MDRGLEQIVKKDQLGVEFSVVMGDAVRSLAHRVPKFSRRIGSKNSLSMSYTVSVLATTLPSFAKLVLPTGLDTEASTFFPCPSFHLSRESGFVA